MLNSVRSSLYYRFFMAPTWYLNYTLGKQLLIMMHFPINGYFSFPFNRFQLCTKGLSQNRCCLWHCNNIPLRTETAESSALYSMHSLQILCSLNWVSSCDHSNSYIWWQNKTIVGRTRALVGHSLSIFHISPLTICNCLSLPVCPGCCGVWAFDEEDLSVLETVRPFF